MTPDDKLEIKKMFADQSKEFNNRFEQIDSRFEQIDGRFEQIDSRFEQIDSRFEQIDSRFEQIDSRFEQIDGRFTENNKEILEAVDFVINKRMNEFSVGFEVFKDEVRGMFKDISKSISDSNSLKDRVENSENIIKNNILPRLDLIEAK